MNSTSPSLLKRLQNHEDEQAWERFTELYVPALYAWTRQLRLDKNEAEELIQEILALLVEKLPRLQYNPDKSFRGWLYTVSMNKWRETRRRARAGIQVSEPLPEELVEEKSESFWELELKQRVISRAFDLLQSDFEESTAEAFRRYSLDGESAKKVASELGITVNAVYLAKSHVVRRLRQELAGLFD